jgi:uncharacterized protein YjbJ (UPF0337 family)
MPARLAAPCPAQYPAPPQSVVERYLRNPPSPENSAALSLTTACHRTDSVAALDRNRGARPHVDGFDTGQRGESAMNWDRVEGNWKQVKGKVKEKWGKLTDDDLDTISGHRDQLEGKLQERYGYAKDQAHREVDSWFSAQKW